MREIIRKNLEKLMILVMESTEASNKQDLARVAEIEASMISIFKGMDEDTLKELRVAVSRLNVEKQAEFKQYRARCNREKDVEAELDNLGKELEELNKLTAESIEAVEQGDQERVAEIEALLKGKTESLLKGYPKA